MVRRTLWPKTYYEWDELWPYPPEITEAEVGAMLDNIDLDFDQSQTTSAKQKYMNCTNDIKSVNVSTIEVVASGLPLQDGAQLAVDITLRCALAADGTAHPNAAFEDGAVCSRTRGQKEHKYAKLLTEDRCGLVMVALETGRRWSNEAVQFIDDFGSGMSQGGTTSPPKIGLLGEAAKMVQDDWCLFCQGFCQFPHGRSSVPPTLAGVDGEMPDMADLLGER